MGSNGRCYPCMMGWGLAGTGNSSAVAAIVVVPLKCSFLENCLLREWIENERSQRDSAGILIVRMLRISLVLSKVRVVS